MTETDITAARIEAGESLRADIQQALHAAMVDWARSEIATRLGWSVARTVALFEHDGDPSMRDIAEFAWAIDCGVDLKMEKTEPALAGSESEHSIHRQEKP